MALEAFSFSTTSFGWFTAHMDEVQQLKALYVYLGVGYCPRKIDHTFRSWYAWNKDMKWRTTMFHQVRTSHDEERFVRSTRNWFKHRSALYFLKNNGRLHAFNVETLEESFEISHSQIISNCRAADIRQRSSRFLRHSPFEKYSQKLHPDLCNVTLRRPGEFSGLS